MPLYFIERDGRPEMVGYSIWEKWCAQNNRQVANDCYTIPGTIDRVQVVTSFLAIDNDYDLRENSIYNLRLPPAGYDPLLYVTVIFPGNFRGHYATRREAEQGHKEVLGMALNGVPLKDIMPRISGVREPRSQPMTPRRAREQPQPPPMEWNAPNYTGIFRGGDGGRSLKEVVMDGLRPSQSPPEPPGPKKSEVVRRFEGLDFDEPKKKP